MQLPFIIILVCCFTNLLAFAQAGNETDRLALLDFKSKVTDDPLGILTSWNESIHFCQWHGVTCSADRVTMLDLQSQNLAGSISPHIGNLSFLTVLQLYNNSFTEEIPPEIGNLQRLQILRLHNNSITGQIPVNISACSSLVRINFANNMLVGNIPVQLGLLSNLQALYLDKNNFTGGIPSSLGNLSSFNDLRASYNNLGGAIPETLGHLTYLTFIGLGYNNLSNTIPASIFNLTNLKEFHASYNNIQGSLPQDFGIYLPKLQTLAIRFNRLSGPIPVSITNASSLLNIMISVNNFSGKLPTLEGLPKLHHIIMSLNDLGTGEVDDSDFLFSLINATELEEVSMDGNNLGGVLPNSISNFSTRLLRLSLANNRMFGSIPTGIGNLINLETLDLRGNQFGGNIPDDIGNLQNLKVLSMFSNKLLGNIPSSLGNLSMLIGFHLGKNDLQGDIPSSLGNCQNLVRLGLAQNKLSGVLPKEVVSITTLAVLNLSQNNLTGSLPMEFGNLINLEQLDVSDNMFSGKILSSLGSCVRLETLYMQGNFFQGTIPSSLNSLRGIQFLDLSRNNLSGEIPDYLEDMKFLQTLNLSYNDFEGSVPTQGVFKNASAISVIGNNMLCGGVLELELPVCNLKASTKRRLSLTVKIIIFTVSGLMGLSLCLLLFGWFRKRRTRPPSISQESSLLKVSYQTLLKATNGFSSTNLIGSGSSGSVYKGILDSQNGTVIAVKVLNLHRPNASKSFIAECEALRNIKHRNLVKVLTVCSSVDYKGNEFKALVYKFVSNGNLDEWLHVNAWDVEANVEPMKKLNLLQRLNIAIDVACAVDYLHNGCQKPVVHCDLKPSNVLLDDEMTAHVGDFGLARFAIQGTNNLFGNEGTSSIGIRGSIGYVAPEYGMGCEVSTYGDVYSYGILLLEMFTGKKPTHEMFKDNLSLHKFAKMAMPKTVEEIADPILLEQEGETSTNTDDTHSQNHVSRETIRKCLISIFKIGISCSVESPRERMDMSDVVVELHLIRNILAGKHGGRRSANTFAL
ncbi:hypothetical protein ACSBR2_027026 [Camellia fascicularis]